MSDRKFEVTLIGRDADLLASLGVHPGIDLSELPGASGLVHWLHETSECAWVTLDYCLLKALFSYLAAKTVKPVYTGGIVEQQLEEGYFLIGPWAGKYTIGNDSTRVTTQSTEKTNVTNRAQVVSNDLESENAVEGTKAQAYTGSGLVLCPCGHLLLVE